MSVSASPGASTRRNSSVERWLIAAGLVFSLVSGVHVSGTRFVRANGEAFAWRGITAFRLVEFVVSGHQREAAAFLDWSAQHHVTVVRVLTMAKHAFELPPERGAATLPRLLALARARHLQVEVVALADTAEYQFDIEKHVTAIGRACAASHNCFVEIANEPYHPTQASPVHNRSYLRKLRTLIPADIPVALGAAERAEDSGGGDYATIHTSRDTGQGGWGHVRALETLRGLPERMKMPVVSDEPIGAAEQLEAGRRDNDPARFAAAAKLTRELGLGATFHYSGGIQGRVPTGRELACFNAWMDARLSARRDRAAESFANGRERPLDLRQKFPRIEPEAIVHDER